MSEKLKLLAENMPLVGLLVTLALLPLAISNTYVLQVAVFAGLYVILALSLNLLNGYVGLMAIGHAGFYGIGAYASAKLTIEAGLPFPLAFIASGLIAATFGWVIGRPTLRLAGIYLALATLGFNIIVWLVLLNWNSFTGGPLGIKGIPQPEIFGWVIDSRAEYYWFMLVLVCLVVLSIERLVNSRFGRALVAIREDELAAAATGIDVTSYKVQAFVISSFYAGIAGSFYAHFVGYISPDSFTHFESFVLLAMLAFGGQGNIAGPILGAVVLVIVPELFRSLSEYRMLMYGIVLILVIQLRPQGILGGRNVSLKLPIRNQEPVRKYRGDAFLPAETEGEG